VANREGSLQGVRIEDFKLADYEAVSRLWRDAGPGVCARPTDELEGIKLRLTRDPDLFLLARSGQRVIGAVIGGWDGWRGYVYHLVVDAELRRRGVAGALMDELESRLRDKGAIKAKCQIYTDNEHSLAFFRRRGYEIEENLHAVGKWLTGWRP